ncbi:MAG: mobile mystery protein B [Beijerinckiaceae bacterium]|nr:mobile mystery protein B [Beijerinckiaceae bacterium]
MTDLFQEPADATPLTPQEREGLRLTWITHRRDLNEAEQDNIVRGAAWARRRRPRRPQDLLDEPFLRALHKNMLGDVWRWAGSYRLTERNIGVDAWRIGTDLGHLLADARYWLEHSTYAPDELAIRLHHRLVAIHPFPNGNGRHARLLADLLIESLGGRAFSWGGGRLEDVSALRRAYVSALRAADNHDIAPLLMFARQ